MSGVLRTPLQSVAAFRRYNTCVHGKCMTYVSRALGGPFGWDGLADPNHAIKRTKRLHHDTHPPAGVPVYILGSKYGHITLSVGGGKVRSTDWPHRGAVGEVGIMTLANSWGREYVGWSEDFVGRIIPGVRLHSPSSSTYPGFQVHRGSQGEVVKTVQRRLIQHGFPLPINGHFGPRTHAAVIAFQRQHHLKVDGWVGRSTWAALWRA